MAQFSREFFSNKRQCKKNRADATPPHQPDAFYKESPKPTTFDMIRGGISFLIN
jgi:hypothetical protein